MEVKNIILQNLLKETEVNEIISPENRHLNPLQSGPSGDKAAAGVAGTKGNLAKVKGRLAKLGIHDLPDLSGINTIEQLAIEPFKFTFVLQDLNDKQEEFNLPKPMTFSLVLARVVKDENYPLVLEIKTKDGDIFKMAFVEEDELTVRLPGTKKPVVALTSESSDIKTSKFYTIVGDANFRKYLISEVTGEEGNQEGGNEEGENKEGEEGEGSQGKKEFGGGNKVSKEGLFNDLAGFFKFTYNNRKMAAPNLIPKEKPKNTVESFINQIAKNVILLKEEGETEEGPEGDKKGDEENKEEGQNEFVIEAKIYVKKIVLGPKAEVRKGEDEEKYASKVSGKGKDEKVATDVKSWDGMVVRLPAKVGSGLQAQIDLTLSPETKLNDDQKEAFKEIQNAIRATKYNNAAIIRRSAKDTDGTTFIVEFKIGGSPVALVCKTKEKAANLKIRSEIEIGTKPAGKEVFTKSTKAVIQIS